MLNNEERAAAVKRSVAEKETHKRFHRRRAAAVCSPLASIAFITVSSAMP